MNIKKIEITNYRSIKNIEFNFDSSLNVFVGVNGSGKTTILDVLITSLSWLIKRIQRENVSGKHILDNDIRNNEEFSILRIFVEVDKEVYDWKLTKTRKGEYAKEKSELSAVSLLADCFRNQLKKNTKLPVIAYYPVNRVVKNIKPEISNKDNFYVLDVYENAIGVKANYQAFFEWFRLQDDILNEKLGSRTKWMINNKKWLKRKTEELLSFMQKISIGGEVDSVEINHLVIRVTENDIFLENPSYLFQEILFFLKSIKKTADTKFRNKMFLNDITLAIKDFEKIISWFNYDKYDYYKLTEILNNIYNRYQIIAFKNLFINLSKFLTLLDLWWLSKASKKQIENFFEGINKQLDDKKESQKFSVLFLNNIEQIINNDANRQDIATKNDGREIQIVTKTIESFIEGYSNLRIKRVPRPHMLVEKNGETFNLEQLSDGEKNLIALVGDIARRLSIANPNDKQPLKGDGIILIDEVDLHLHPAWQRLIIPKLTELFPNCQFFITTHSPQVLSHVKPQNIFLIKNENNELSYSKPEESYGKNTDRILEDILGVTSRPVKTTKDIKEIYNLIADNKLEEAKEKISKLEQEIGSDTELTKANVLIKRKEIIGK